MEKEKYLSNKKSFTTKEIFLQKFIHARLIAFNKALFQRRSLQPITNLY
jgi:hypothetical protein